MRFAQNKGIYRKLGKNREKGKIGALGSLVSKSIVVCF